jgi:hypothetical protein
VLKLALLGYGKHLKRWVLAGGLQITGGALKGTVEPQSLPLSFCFPDPEVSSFALPHAPVKMCCLATGPKTMRPSHHGCEPK